MKIVKYKGGLGNQMFQYAFGRGLQENHQQQVASDLSIYFQDNEIKKTEILKYDIRLEIADKGTLDKILLFQNNLEIFELGKKIQSGLEAVFNKNYYLEYSRAWRNPEDLLKYSYYDGYWQSWRYLTGIEEKLKKEFQLKGKIGQKSQYAIAEYSGINSVMVGIRRGDYLQERKHYGIYGQEYYLHCMDYITDQIKDPIFVIFSNDIEWVKNNMDFKNNKVIYRTKELQDSDAEELIVMASCQHFIIVNSTYQWWGAWLSKNPEKIVLVPDKWFADNKPIDIVPPGWIRI